MNPDFTDLLDAFSAADVRYLVVGAYAVMAHTRPRTTNDLDVWVEPTAQNASRVVHALREFGAPAVVTEQELTTPDLIVQIGVPPRRIDILTSLLGVSFSEAWDGRLMARIGSTERPIIGRDALIRNKRAVGRPRDLDDVEALGG